MQLYFLRHGEADWPGWTKPDDERPLTDFGKKEARQVAKFLNRLKVKPDLIVSSPLPRALQTAEAAAEQLKAKLREDEALEIDPQRQDCKSLSTMKRGHVAEKKDAEMTPSFGPILIHCGWGRVGTEKALIIIGHGHSRMGAQGPLELQTIACRPHSRS